MKPLLSISLGEPNQEKSYQVIKFTGELDKAGFDGVRTRLDDIIKNFKLNNLIFDFSNLGFINSESIGYLADVNSLLNSKNQNLILIGADDHVKDVLKVSGVAFLIPMYKTMENYVQS